MENEYNYYTAFQNMERLIIQKRITLDEEPDKGKKIRNKEKGSEKQKKHFVIVYL
jgi:hypothetical protein